MTKICQNQKAVVASEYTLFSPFLGANGLTMTCPTQLYISTFTPSAFIFGQGTAPFRMHRGVQADAQCRPEVSGERLATIDWGLKGMVDHYVWYGLSDNIQTWVKPDNKR